MDSDRPTATILAAEILIANVLGVLSGLEYSTTHLNRAVSALFALDWAPSTIETLGPTRLTRFFTRLKISRLSKKDYRVLLKTMMVSSSDVSAIFPFSMEEWRQVIVRFDLAKDRPFHEWLTIIHDLTTHLVDTPSQLSGYSFGEISGFSERCTNPGAVLRLWQATCISHGVSQHTPRSLHFETNASLLAQSVRAPTLADTGFAISHKRAREKLDVPPEFRQGRASH